MEIQLTIDDRKVRNLLNLLPDRATDMTPAMQAIGRTSSCIVDDQTVAKTTGTNHAVLFR